MTVSKHKLPVIAIVGRPNVGKSSLFNRLIHKRHAIISKTAGTTRDRIYQHAELDRHRVVLVDTGGLEYGKKENIESDVRIQAELAIAEADIIIFMLDAKEGLTIEDYEAATKLRRAEKKIIVVANKFDTKKAIDDSTELLTLGFGEPIQISAYHNRNVGEVIDAVEDILDQQEWPANIKVIANKPKEELELDEDDQNPEEETENQTDGKVTNVAFLGKPNVGKSSLVNALFGKQKVIVSEIPGTTRDAIDTEITWNGDNYNLIDTAGLRRRGKIEKGLEKLSSFRSLEAIERADVVCLIMDYHEGIKKQDQHIASYILDAGKGLILVVNKSDLMESRETDERKTIGILRRRFDFLPWAPVIFTSALKKANVEKILEIAKLIKTERGKWIPREQLVEFMKEVTYKHLPPSQGNRIPRFYTMEQDAVNPPCFVYWVSAPKSIHFSYRRYLENELRKKFGFNGTSIKLYFKEKKGARKRRRFK